MNAQLTPTAQKCPAIDEAVGRRIKNHSRRRWRLVRMITSVAYPALEASGDLLPIRLLDDGGDRESR
jgi:hypothetical protein